MCPRRLTTMNDRLRGDELVLRIIQQLARGESLDRFIDALPPNHRRMQEPHPAGVGLLQVLSLDGSTALQESFTTQPVPMDRDTQIRNYHYDTHTAVLELYGVLYDARTTHPWNIRIPQTHHGCEQDMKRARAACAGEAANLQESFMIVAEGVSAAMDRAAETLNKLGVDLTSDDEDDDHDEDKGDFDCEQDI